MLKKIEDKIEKDTARPGFDAARNKNNSSDEVEIVRHSMLGVFSDNFKIGDFKKNRIKFEQVFVDSEILQGI